MCGYIYSLMKFRVIMLAGWPKRRVRILLTTHYSVPSTKTQALALIIHRLPIIVSTCSGYLLSIDYHTRLCAGT